MKNPKNPTYDPAPGHCDRPFLHATAEKGRLRLDEQILQLFADGGLLLCSCGECNLEVNCQSYSLHGNDMFICLPNSLVRILGHSDDFQASILSIQTSYVRKLNIDSMVSFYMGIKECPLVPLTDAQFTSMQRLTEAMCGYDIGSHPYRNEILSHLMMICSYEIVNIYSQHRPIDMRPRTRQDAMLQQFLSLLVSDYTISREVAYYANKMCITPKYLSLVVNRASGKSAAQWINEMVILNAKNLLRGSQLTIQQVADRLNFPNPSFFGQYFRRQTGLTPKQYRMQ